MKRLLRQSSQLMILSALLATAAPAHARPVIAVGNLRDGSVTVVDQRSLKVLGLLDVTPDGKSAYIANSGTFRSGTQSPSIFARHPLPYSHLASRPDCSSSEQFFDI